MDSEENAIAAAKREALEEAGLTAVHIDVRATVVTAEVAALGGGTWTYTTVVADAPECVATVANRESVELRWVAEEEVATLPLHPAFAESWEKLLRIHSYEAPAHDCGLNRPHTVVIDETFAWCNRR